MAGIVVAGINGPETKALIDKKSSSSSSLRIDRKRKRDIYYGEMAITSERYSINTTLTTLTNTKYDNSKINYDNNRPNNYKNNNSSNVNMESVTVPLCLLGDVQLRFLCPDDLEEVRALCQDWFPIGKFKINNYYYLFPDN